MATPRLTSSLFAALLLLSCSDLEQDKFASQGGVTPDPVGVLEGTILYVGPRPLCDYAASGAPSRVVGNVVLSLFEFDNPPPPEGSAQSAVNLLAVSGDELFDLTDCPASPGSSDVTQRISRSVVFRWPRIALNSKESSYQIRGFYDTDGDMIPFFSTTRVPTAGDVIGAALNDVQDATKGLQRVTLPPLEAAPNDVVRRGLTVALGSVVWTERPVFQLSPSRRLAADAPFAPAIDIVDERPVPNAAASVRGFHRLTCASPAGGDECGFSLQRLGAADVPKLEAGAVRLAIDSDAYTFFAQPVDLKTVERGKVDLNIPDGMVDPHPLLGGLGVPWFTPMVIMQRTPIDEPAVAREREASIPRVLLFGSVLLDDMKRPLKAGFKQPPIAVPPIAVVELAPARPECRVPYFPPGTAPQLLSDRVAVCAELPTGFYSVTAFGGIAGGRAEALPAGVTSDSALNITGGRFSGQSWTVPNELADPAQNGGEGNVLASQALSAGFVVHDPSPSRGECPTQPGFGLCSMELTFGESAIDGLDVQKCLPDYCCEAISHLCGLPLCAATERAEGRITESPTAVGVPPGGRRAAPNCVPFELPPVCCPPR